MFTITYAALQEYLRHPKVATWYTLYIHSDKWQKLRERCFKKYGKKCQRCGTRKKPHILHHKTYERVTKEMIEDMAVVCMICHSQIEHSIIPFIDRIYQEDYKP